MMAILKIEKIPYVQSNMNSFLKVLYQKTQYCIILFFPSFISIQIPIDSKTTLYLLNV